MTDNQHSSNSVPSAIPSTLEELQRQKAAVLQKIQVQKRAISRLSKEVAAPFAPAVEKGNSAMRAFNRGMAIFDGVMIGMKLIRKFKSLFGNRRRYRY